MSKYDPLRHHLSSLKGDVWRVSFREIEAILGSPIPKSAYTYNAWWANDKHGSHIHVIAWLKAGWKTESVNLAARRVVFQKADVSQEEEYRPRKTQPGTKKKQLPVPSSAAPRIPNDISSDKIITLVSCVKLKLARSAPAKDLYTSPLFTKSKKFVEKTGCRWFVLSALHGLVAPDDIISPYEKTLKNMPADERRAWAQNIFQDLKKILSPRMTIMILTGKSYTENLIPLLEAEGYRIVQPLQGLSMGQRLAELSRLVDDKGQTFSNADIPDQIRVFYDLMDRLTKGLGGGRRLMDCDGRMAWPERGVYFILDPHEMRKPPLLGQRIVRVGTHAINPDARTTIWERLSNHRGPKSGIDNHRKSVFRRHVGTAMMRREPERFVVESWGKGKPASRGAREAEHKLEQAVSDYIGQMTVVWLAVDDEPGTTSDRAYLERCAIASLSTWSLREAAPAWLGHFSADEKIRASGLWNVHHVGGKVDVDFMDTLEQYVEVTVKLYR